MTDGVKYKGEKHEGLDYLEPYPASHLASSVDLVEIVKEEDMVATRLPAGLSERIVWKIIVPEHR